MGNQEKKMGPLIILHGWTYSIKRWKPFLRLLEKSGIEYEMLKIPGLTAPLDHVWTLDDYVSWLHLRTKNEERIALLGHSNGGRISQGFAKKYPQKVSRLILIDSAGIYHQDITIQIKRFVFGNLALLKRFISTSFLQDLFYKIVREYDYHRASPLMKKVLQNLLDSDKNNRLEEVNVPTTIIWGENDNVTPLSDGKIMKEKIANSSLNIINGAGHSPQFTNTSEVARIVISILKNHGNI